MTMIMKSLCFCLVILASFATLDARRFYVGGNGVWGSNPQENYKTWAERNRFQVNDTLYFKYAKGSDSVQQVMKSDFEGCFVKNPVKRFDNGETEVTLDRSGPFYFVSGNEDLCKKGQKLVVVVLADRSPPTGPISPAKPPAPAQSPKSQPPKSSASPSHAPKSQPPKSSVAPAPAPKSSVSPAHAPKSSVAPAQAPKSPSPVAPSHAPAKAPTTPSPSPKSPSPVAPAKGPSTQSSPPAPTPTNSPKSSPSPAPADQTPASQPPENTPPTAPAPSESTPASDHTTPAPAPAPKSSASGKSVTSVLATVLTAAFTVFMLA